MSSKASPEPKKQKKNKVEVKNTRTLDSSWNKILSGDYVFQDYLTLIYYLDIAFELRYESCVGTTDLLNKNFNNKLVTSMIHKGLFIDLDNQVKVNRDYIKKVFLHLFK